MKCSKKLVILLVALLSIFGFSSSITAYEIIDWGSGASGSASGLGSGDWKTEYVGLKVNIITNDEKLQISKIFVNKKCTDDCKFATKASKILAASDYSVKWSKQSSTYTTKLKSLPSSWCNNSGCSSTVNIHDWLTKKDYSNLKEILTSMIGTVNDDNLIDYYDSYIVIEPMIRIGDYYGTAFELGKAFFDIGEISSKNTFAYNYAKNVFGGNSNGGAKLLYSTISVSTKIEDLGIKNYKSWLSSNDKYGKYGSEKYGEYIRRNYCITRGRTCGRAMGVFSFKDLYDYKELKINKVFSNKNQSTSNVKFKLEKYYNDKWNDTGKTCTAKINKSTGKGNCKIDGLTNGTYRIIEDSLDNTWEVECTSGCSNTSSVSPLKIRLTSDKSVVITNTKKSTNKYDLTINKVDESGNLIKTAATFYIYSGSGCKTLKQTATTKDGVIKIQGLTSSYSFKEITAPEGFEKDNTCYNVNSSNKTFNIVNRRGCQAEFESKKVNGQVSMADRVALYQIYNNNKNLLNMSNTDASAACSEYTPNYEKSMSCLSSSLDNNALLSFNSSNLSNYNDIENLDINGTSVVGYCLTTLNFENQLEDSATNFNTYAGMMLIKGSLATKLQLSKKCYFFNENNGYKEYTSIAPYDENNFDYYVSDVMLGDTNLFDLNSSATPSELPYSKNNADNSYSFSVIKEYSLPEIYVSNGSGKVTDSDCDNCKFLGNGIITNLDASIDNRNLEFTYKSDFFDLSNVDNGICTYNVEPRIIRNNDLALEFRTISTNNPFPGSTGNIRNVGNNWCTIDTCAGSFEENELINNIIKNRPNSYGIIPSTNQSVGPKYVIKLTPSAIKEIRNDNKGNSYEDYDLECIENGEICISNYLTNLKQKGIITVLTNEKRPKFEE